MIEKILNYYFQNGISRLVAIKDDMLVDNKDLEAAVGQFNTETIADARSAMFYAYGKAKMEQEPIILLVNGSYLSSIYTGLTEAWFQRTPVIVVAYNEVYQQGKYEYIRVCLKQLEDLDKIPWEDTLPLLERAKNDSGPSLFYFNYNLKETPKKNYIEYLSFLKGILGAGDTVFCYNMLEKPKESYNFSVYDIAPQHKFGIISKYVGYLLGNSGRTILYCPLEMLELDSNIFNNRYVDKKFKIFFEAVDDVQITKYKAWIENNHIDTLISDNLSVPTFRKFIDAPNATVMFIKGD